LTIFDPELGEVPLVTPGSDKKKIEKIVSRKIKETTEYIVDDRPKKSDTKQPRHHDTTVSRYHDTKTPMIHGVTVEVVRKAVKEFGKEAATHRFTEAEKRRVADIIYTYKNQAVKLGLIGRNPCSGTNPPRPTQTEMKFYDDREVKALLKTAKDTQSKLYPLYYLAIHTGMRQAELIGLKWEDIDWSLGTIQVKRQVRHFKGASYMFLEPKSKSGTRTIIVGKSALEVLKDHKEEQEQLIVSAGENWCNLDLVFPSGVGTPMTASNIRRDFRKLLSTSGLPKIRFHDLRHTAVSLMLNHAIPVLIVSKRLGHSKASITIDVYGHLIPSRQEEAAQLMDNLMFAG
jgi:integrase